MKKLLLLLFFLLGIACLAWYFFSGKQETIYTPAIGLLQSDTAPLGMVSVYDTGFIAGNSHGEIRVFAAGEKPKILKLSENPISAPVYTQSGISYVGDENGTFWAFTPEQGVIWSYKTGNQITGGAVEGNGMIWTGSHDYTLYAFHPETGKLLHTIECDGQINGTPVISGNYIYIGSCDGILRKINMQTGILAAQLDFQSHIPSSPVCDGDLFILTHNGQLASINTDSFQIRYSIQNSETYLTSPFLTESHIFLTDTNGKVHVHSRTDGKRVLTLPAKEKLTPVTDGFFKAIHTLSTTGKLSSWDSMTWHETHVADFKSNFKSGILSSGNTIAAQDEYGNLFFCK